MTRRPDTRIRLLCGLAVCTLVAPTTVRAQVQVRVTTADGTPVPAVRVDVYGTAERIRTLTTNADGTVELGPDRWDDVRRISLSHLGFEPVLIQRDELSPLTAVRLAPEALPIEGFDVRVVGRTCPLAGSDEARALWAEVAARYSTDTGRRPLYAEFGFDAGPQMSDRLMSALDPPGRTSGSRHTAPGRTTASSGGPLEQMIEQRGYSWPGPRREWSARHLRRWYPSLEMWDAYHFATHTFGERHDFEVLSERGDAVRLAFCPRDGATGTTLSGVLELVRGDRFLQARWKFHADGVDEDAGGVVTFVTHREGTRRLPHLLAGQGVFFRHGGHDPPYPELPRAYYREVFANVEWRVLPPGAARR
jgi:hypothetical protein